MFSGSSVKAIYHGICPYQTLIMKSPFLCLFPPPFFSLFSVCSFLLLFPLFPTLTASICRPFPSIFPSFYFFSSFSPFLVIFFLSFLFSFFIFHHIFTSLTPYLSSPTRYTLHHTTSYLSTLVYANNVHGT